MLNTTTQSLVNKVNQYLGDIIEHGETVSRYDNDHYQYTMLIATVYRPNYVGVTVVINHDTSYADIRIYSCGRKGCDTEIVIDEKLDHYLTPSQLVAYIRRKVKAVNDCY